MSVEATDRQNFLALERGTPHIVTNLTNFSGWFLTRDLAEEYIRYHKAHRGTAELKLYPVGLLEKKAIDG